MYEMHFTEAGTLETLGDVFKCVHVDPKLDYFCILYKYCIIWLVGSLALHFYKAFWETHT